jgi:hypothetical protein
MVGGAGSTGMGREIFSSLILSNIYESMKGKNNIFRFMKMEVQ